MNSGRGDFEGVMTGHRLLDVEDHRHLPRQSRERVEVDATLAVDEQAHDLPSTFGSVLDVDQLESLLCQYRLDQCDHPVSTLHSSNKKVGLGPTFFAANSTGSGTTGSVSLQPSAS